MSETSRVMIVEDNPQLSGALECFLAEKKEIRVVAVARNAYDAIRALEEADPQIVILDMVMPQGDGFVFLEHVKYRHRGACPRVIVLSAVSSDAIITRACEMGVAYYLVKPFSLEILYDRVRTLLSAPSQRHLAPKDPNELSLIEKRVKTIFLAAGMTGNLKGHFYLSEAVRLTVVYPELIHQMTKQLYPQLGEMFHTTASNVERAIRHVVQQAHESGKLERLNSVLSTDAFRFAEKPTNSELIALIARHIG